MRHAAVSNALSNVRVSGTKLSGTGSFAVSNLHGVSMLTLRGFAVGFSFVTSCAG